MAKTSQHNNQRHKSGTYNITGGVVVSAINKLMKNTGWTARTIIKYIKREYENIEIDDRSLSRKVSRCLKQGVTLGLLECNRGRFRLNHDISALVVPDEMMPTENNSNHQQRQQQPGREQPEEKTQPRKKEQPFRIRSSSDIIY